MATKSVWSLTSEAAKYSVVSHFHYLYISRKYFHYLYISRKYFHYLYISRKYFHYLYISRKYFHYLYFSSIFYVLFQSRPSQPAAIVETAVRSAVT